MLHSNQFQVLFLGFFFPVFCTKITLLVNILGYKLYGTFYWLTRIVLLYEIIMTARLSTCTRSKLWSSWSFDSSAKMTPKYSFHKMTYTTVTKHYFIKLPLPLLQIELHYTLHKLILDTRIEILYTTQIKNEVEEH